MQESITTLPTHCHLLPDADQVFAPQDAFLAQHLLPLMSIDLTQINSTWSGIIHLLNPIEPYEGYIGATTTEFHNEFSNENWFILQLDDQNHYHWLTDPYYFIVANENHPSYKDALSHSQKIHADYLTVKQRFIEQNKIISSSRLEYQNNEPTTLLNQLGGEAYYSNWCYPIDEHLNLKNTELEESCLTHIFDQQGQRYYFIASASGWEYCNHGADDILMFYQPETKRVLFTFDWT